MARIIQGAVRAMRVARFLAVRPQAFEQAPERRLIRWLSELIVTGQLAPEHGGRLIWLGVWPDSNYPAVLRPLVEGVIQWEDNPRET
jgi:hypothetical protein